MSLRLRLASLALVFALPALAQAAAPPGDAKKGEVLFKTRCGICHSTAPDAPPGPGPSLAGLVDRKAAAAPGFSYSPALKASGLTWDRASLDRFLTAPGALVPGTFMAIALPNAAERQDVLTYLSTVKAPGR